jgi:prophage regulatory protein
MNPFNLSNHKFLRLDEVKSLTGLSKSTIYFWMAQKKFPSQIGLGSRIVVWDQKAIHDWMQAQTNS